MENLWLDIVIAVDASESMGNIGLSELLGTLSTALGGITVGQGLKHQTRMALVSYASKAKVVAPLTQYTAFEELIAGLSGIEATNDAEVNLLEYSTANIRRPTCEQNA
ncbi:Protein CLEC-64 [Aphelenchoides avenae]|nr:Protein CLEC-64 [Aphelenchus avenae]